MTIKILSDSTINKISAGEVIERPASVVKELVENAIDAGATKIAISLECAGKNLILVKDNGFGMTREELEIAVLRHATSKLDEDDLLNINSFGFRGEALPSIGAISKFKITSKKRGASAAYSLSIIGGRTEPTIISNLNEGTIIEVRDLFFATPARLKFLRSDKTELAAIVLIVKRIALSHPLVAFTLTHDGKELLNVKAVSQLSSQSNDQSNIEPLSLIKNRVEEILGSEFIENSAQISHFKDDIQIYGYSSIPTYNRAANDDQFLFINNRPVKDKILNIALKVAYRDYLANNRHPLSVLFIKVDPHFVDVNVHPAKSEVRFHNPNLIQSMVISAIKNALESTSHQVSNVASSVALNYMSAPNTLPGSRPALAPVTTPLTGFTENNNSAPRSFALPHVSGETKPRDYYSPTAGRIDYELSNNNRLINTQPHSNVEAHITPQIEEVNFPLGSARAQFHGTYIISQTIDSIIITDQHAAHERIGYEKIKEQITKNGLIKQRLLIPCIIELPDVYRAELLDEKKLLLAELGLTIEKFGGNSIIVSEIPSLIGDANINKLIHDIADHLQAIGENIALTELIEHVTETYACHYAIRAGRTLKADEMNGLLRQMENTPFSGQCNHGRQTYVELKVKDIEKLFGRK